MRKTCILVITLLILPLFAVLLSGAGTENPEIMNQGQSTSSIQPEGSINLYAQGKDDDALQRAWLSTNENGVWQAFKGWWNFSWAYCKPLRIDHTKVDADLANFSVLITTTSSDFIDHAQPTGYDFVFTDATNTTQYHHEIESYNSASGELVVWVNIPFISVNQDTILYLYYGNPTCSNQQNSEGTWDADYLMIHHMTGIAATDLKDSTANHWDITTAGGTPTYNQTGKIGKAVDFPSASYLKTDSFRLPVDQAYTASAWVYVDGGLSTQRYIFEGDSSNYAISLSVATDGRFWVILNTSQGMIGLYSTTYVSITSPQWIYVCSQVDTNTNTMKLFVNGVPEGSKAIPGAVLAESEGLNIAANKNNNGNYMVGLIDEIRVSNVARNDAWIHAEYTMMSSPSHFLVIGQEITPGQIQRYGSPLTLQENTQWQWTNFTWQNPAIPERTVISWRITYQDTSGNTNQTESMSYTILGSPPAVPQAPDGPSTGTVGITYTFTATTTDADTDDISFLFNWGDGNQSGWTDFSSSGSSVIKSYDWHQPGAYLIKVKAKDLHGAETDWSAPSLMTITLSPLPALAIDAPASVVEGSLFDVLITSAGIRVQNALVSFSNTTYSTDSTGKVTLLAPAVETTTILLLSVQHANYQSATKTITITSTDQPQETKGWVYGWVANSSGALLKNAQVCIFVSGKNTTALCAFTDDQGRYNFLVTVGTYTIEARKYGYLISSKTNIKVQENHALELNFLLQQFSRGTSQLPANEQRDLIEAMIDAGIASKKIMGTLDVRSSQQNYTLSVYNNNLSADVLSLNISEVIFTLEAENLPGTIFAVQIESQQEVSGIVVMVDNRSLQHVGFSEIFDMENKTEAAYAQMLDTSDGKTTAYCLVYLPHFSEHQISIKAILGGIQVFGGTIAVVAYVVVAIIAFVVLIIPIVQIERKRP